MTAKTTDARTEALKRQALARKLQREVGQMLAEHGDWSAGNLAEAIVARVIALADHAPAE